MENTFQMTMVSAMKEASRAFVNAAIERRVSDVKKHEIFANSMQILQQPNSIVQ